MAESKSGRRCRLCIAEFKADLVATCKQPGVSIAAIALANGMNANVLRRWLAEDRKAPAGTSEPAGAMKVVGVGSGEPAFVPVKVEERATTPDIRIELRRAATTVTVTWPITAGAECAGWMRELMK